MGCRCYCLRGHRNNLAVSSCSTGITFNAAIFHLNLLSYLRAFLRRVHSLVLGSVTVCVRVCVWLCVYLWERGFAAHKQAFPERRLFARDNERVPSAREERKTRVNWTNSNEVTRHFRLHQSISNFAPIMNRIAVTAAVATPVLCTAMFCFLHNTYCSRTLDNTIIR